MKRILVIAALVAATSSLAFGQMKGKKAVQQMHQSGSAERAVMQMEHEFAACVEKSDTVTYGRLVGDDYTFTTQDAVVRTKGEIIASFKSGVLKYESVSFDDIKVRLYGNTAVVIGRSTVKGQDKGQDISGQYRYTRVYVKRQGRWQLVANQSTRIAAA